MSPEELDLIARCYLEPSDILENEAGTFEHIMQLIAALKIAQANEARYLFIRDNPASDEVIAQ